MFNMVRKLFQRFTLQGRLENTKRKRKKVVEKVNGPAISREAARRVLDAVKQKSRLEEKIIKLESKIQERKSKKQD
jgi:DNA gyrase/topoisomerase IV subunit B